jgi:hypothetical protein
VTFGLAGWRDSRKEGKNVNPLTKAPIGPRGKHE